MIVRARTEINEHLLERALKGEKIRYKSQPSSFFFNSGSSSLRFFLRLNGQGKRVGVQVLTCSTVLDAIYAEGCVPVFLDISTEYYTTTMEYVKERVAEIDILLLTHLFGIPNPDYIEIKKMCLNHHIVLIDDLCQTYKAKIGDKYLEELSDNYFYSFFYDKPISTLAGGLLKLSDIFRDEAEIRYNKLQKETNKAGEANLKVLLLMHKLLSPELYTKEFRNGQAWKWVLKKWPMSLSVKILNLFVKGKWMSIMDKLFKKASTSVIRMSDVEISYILSMMDSYTSNNQKLIDFYKKKDIDMPKYLLNPSIECSVAKRAIVDSKVFSSDVQVGLYNWPVLICDKEDYSKYPNAANVIETHTNIPCWMSNSDCYESIVVQ